jgi:hypothetical protein
MSRNDIVSSSNLPPLAAPVVTASEEGIGLGGGASGRRLLPSCRTKEETVMFIEAHYDKWVALRKGNLCTVNWDCVSNTVIACFS